MNQRVQSVRHTQTASHNTRGAYDKCNEYHKSGPFDVVNIYNKNAYVPTRVWKILIGNTCGDFIYIHLFSFIYLYRTVRCYVIIVIVLSLILAKRTVDKLKRKNGREPTHSIGSFDRLEREFSKILSASIYLPRASRTNRYGSFGRALNGRSVHL